MNPNKNRIGNLSNTTRPSRFSQSRNFYELKLVLLDSISFCYSFLNMRQSLIAIIYAVVITNSPVVTSASSDVCRTLPSPDRPSKPCIFPFRFQGTFHLCFTTALMCLIFSKFNLEKRSSKGRNFQMLNKDAKNFSQGPPSKNQALAI